MASPKWGQGQGCRSAAEMLKSFLGSLKGQGAQDLEEENCEFSKRSSSEPEPAFPFPLIILLEQFGLWRARKKNSFTSKSAQSSPPRFLACL